MPKAMIRIYLADGQFKSLVLDQNVNCDEAVSTIIEKLQTTSTSNWDDCLLFQSLDFGKEIIELNAGDCPYTIAQWWGESSDSNRFVFKKASEPLKKGIPGFEKYKASRVERRSTNPVKARRMQSRIGAQNDYSDSFMVQQGAPPSHLIPPPHPNYNSAPVASGNPLPPPVQNKPAIMGYNPLAPNTAGPYRPTRPPPPPAQQDTNVGARPPMERVPMPGFGGNVGGGMDHNALQEKIKNMKAQQNVQIDSVLAWINMNLQTKSMSVHDLSKDMKDGVALASLCEVLTKKPLHYNANPKSDMQMRDNLEATFKAFESAGVKATGAAPNDFLIGNQRSILGYLLLLVKKFKDARSSRRFSKVLTSSGPLITGRASGGFSPNAPNSPGMSKPNNAPIVTSPLKPQNPNEGRRMPPPPAVPAFPPKVAPAVPGAPKKTSLPPPPVLKKSSLPPVPPPPAKKDLDLGSFMDSLVESLDPPSEDWGAENTSQNNDYSYDYQQQSDNYNTYETNNTYGNTDSYGSDNTSYDYSGDNTSYEQSVDNTYDSGTLDYGNTSYDEPKTGSNPNFVAMSEDDPDLFDTFNELEDMLSEMANELGVYDS